MSIEITNSWFAISLLGCGGQCQPPTPAGSNNGINDIFLCVVPQMPWRQIQIINNNNKWVRFSNIHFIQTGLQILKEKSIGIGITAGWSITYTTKQIIRASF